MSAISKIKCIPTEAQKSLIEEILTNCHKAQKLYLDRNKNYYHDTKKVLPSRTFRQIANKLKNTNYECFYLKQIPVRALYSAIKSTEDEVIYRLLNGESLDDISNSITMVQSFGIGKRALNLTIWDKNKIMIPTLQCTKITGRCYLPDVRDVTAVTISKEDDNYFILITYDD